MSSISAWRKEATQLISAMELGLRAWYWKDPRLSVTLAGFWQQFWDDPIYVITVLEPADTALSLHKILQITADRRLFIVAALPDSCAQAYGKRIATHFCPVRTPPHRTRAAKPQALRIPKACCGTGSRSDPRSTP